jgi:dipeptidyl aminopeptidase/acylaminoacyl peptidase
MMGPSQLFFVMHGYAVLDNATMPVVGEPILLIHGEADNNSGTFPIQSERLFQAINGNGGTARLVMLPFESHGYHARESVLHVLVEMFEWADQYVKNRSFSGGSPAAATAAPPAR